MASRYETFLLTPVHALNDIRSNVWAVGLILVGVWLVLHGHDAIGNSLIIGSFAVFRSSDTHTAPIPPNSAPMLMVKPPVKPATLGQPGCYDE